MIVQKLKVWIQTILGAPLLLLAPFVRRSVRKLEAQIDNDPESVPEDIRSYHDFTKKDELAYEALKKGDYGQAKSISLDLLNEAEQYPDDWTYGNAIHHGNTVLGLVAIKENNIGAALKYLKRSGEVSGSPQLESYGPSTCLAIELLLKEKNTEVVEYLKSVTSFWELGHKELPQWIEEVQSGRIPERWKRLEY